jgi:hypothetical protein
MYVIDELPPADSCYYKIRQHFMEHNGMIFFFMTYIYIDKIVYCNNKKLINKFIIVQDKTKISFN